MKKKLKRAKLPQNTKGPTQRGAIPAAGPGCGCGCIGGRLEGQPQLGTNCHLSANSGLPAIVVPGGFTPDGLPVGVELLGRAWSEPQLIKLAYAYEQATRHRRPPASTPALARP